MRKLNRTFGLGRLNLRASKVWRAPVRPPEGGTADALQRAIGLTLQVPESSSLRWQASEAIDEWSQRILALGVEQSSSDLAGAIATLKKIPSGTRAFEQARPQIEVWEESLNPPDAESPPPEPPETEPPRRSPSR